MKKKKKKEAGAQGEECSDDVEMVLMSLCASLCASARLCRDTGARIVTPVLSGSLFEYSNVAGEYTRKHKLACAARAHTPAPHALCTMPQQHRMSAPSPQLTFKTRAFLSANFCSLGLVLQIGLSAHLQDPLPVLSSSTVRQAGWWPAVGSLPYVTVASLALLLTPLPFILKSHDERQEKQLRRAASS